MWLPIVCVRSMWLPMFGVKEHVAPNCSLLRTTWLPMFCVEEHVAPNVLCGGARGSLLSVFLFFFVGIVHVAPSCFGDGE